MAATVRPGLRTIGLAGRRAALLVALVAVAVAVCGAARRLAFVAVAVAVAVAVCGAARRLAFVGVLGTRVSVVPFERVRVLSFVPVCGFVAAFVGVSVPGDRMLRPLMGSAAVAFVVGSVRVIVVLAL